MTLEVNTFILAVNYKLIISHWGTKKMMIIRGGNDGIM
jgi:hypothetical protein